MKDVCTIMVFLVLKQYYQNLHQFIKCYSPNHALLRLIENWKNSWDNNGFVGTVLLDLYMGFDCIPHDLLVAKIHAYGLSEDAVTLCIHT